MPSYRLYGFTVNSDLPLVEATPVDGPADITIAAAPSSVPSSVLRPPSSDWFDIWQIHGRSWVRAVRSGDAYVVRHGDLATFGIDRRSRSITYDAPGCPETTLRHYLLDQVLPLMLSLDSLVLHASSVTVGGEISAFIGPGGAGKSTLALALSRIGCPMASDDALRIELGAEKATAVPAYPWVRLWPDSVAVLSAEPPAYVSCPAPLARVYTVEVRPSASPAFERLYGGEAVMAIVEQAYRLAVDDRGALARQLDDIVTLVRHVSVWRLTFPRNLQRWRELAESVEAHLRDTAVVGRR